MPKFGEWDVNDPATAESFTVIFNKARDEKKASGNAQSPTSLGNDVPTYNTGVCATKPAVSFTFSYLLYLKSTLEIDRL